MTLFSYRPASPLAGYLFTSDHQS